MSRDGEVRSTPRVYDRDRGLFERVYQEGNMLVRASIELDTSLDELSPIKIHPEARLIELTALSMTPEEYAEKLYHIGEKAVKTIEKAEANGEGTWTEYLRFASQTATLAVRGRAESYFMMYDAFDSRRNLTDGITAQFVRLIKNTLVWYYDTLDKKGQATTHAEREQLEQECNQLRGGLSELVILALANYNESPSMLALTPRVIDDLYGKTDISLFYTNDTEKASYKVPIQVKTKRPWQNGNRWQGEVDKRQIPKNGFVLYLSDYDPEGHNTLAMQLVRHFEDPSSMTEDMHQYVLGAKDKLHSDIRSHTDINPGFQLAQIQGMPGEVSKSSRLASVALSRLLASHLPADGLGA